MSDDLKQQLIARISATGPISVAEYMAECLLHPEHGYYSAATPFGAKGDFVTAPEISQMFGELIGLAVAQCWLDQGQPEKAWLAELGPGRGTMMADMLRVIGRVPGAADALRPCLMEASAKLRDIQASTLTGVSPVPIWISEANDIPEGPVFVIANEYLDALPVRQFERKKQGWCERQVGVNQEELVFGLAPETDVPALRHRLDDTASGQVIETCAPAVATVDAVSGRIAEVGGAALFVDYGDWRSLGDTLQAVQEHQPVDPLMEPGRADLTAHVDFEPLADVARNHGLGVSLLTPQGMFLERLGIGQRATDLARNLHGSALEQHVFAHRRLTHPEEMGTLFKCLALTPEGTGPFPGMAAQTSSGSTGT